MVVQRKTQRGKRLVAYVAPTGTVYHRDPECAHAKTGYYITTASVEVKLTRFDLFFIRASLMACKACARRTVGA